MGSTVIGRRVQFDWLKTRFDDIRSYYGSSFPSFVDNILEGFWSDATSQEEIDELRDFLKEKRAYLGSAIDVIGQGIDRSETNRQWMNANYDKVLTWLKENQPNGSSQLSLNMTLLALCLIALISLRQ